MSPRGGVTDHQAAAFRAAREVGWSLRARLDDLEQHTLELQRLDQVAKENAEQEAQEAKEKTEQEARKQASTRILLHLRHLFVRVLRLSAQFIESQAHRIIRRAEAATSIKVVATAATRVQAVRRGSVTRRKAAQVKFHAAAR
jgi:hypothetical protein